MTTSSLQRWKAGAMTPATIAIILQDLIAAAHWVPIPQYAVFRLIPITANIVSFNWDGLASARCSQPVLCPHGVVRPQLYSPVELDVLLDDFQYFDSEEPRDWIIPDLVMPGEEEGAKLASMRDKVLKLWLGAPQVTVIGYSFGIRSALNYDRVWLDTFVEALRTNHRAAVHILAPDAVALRAQLAEQLKRTVNVHAWPVNWYALALAMLKIAERRKCSTAAQLRRHATEVQTLYEDLARRASAIA